MHLKAVIYTFLLISIFNFRFSSAAVNSVTFSQVLEDSETLVSSNANFKLGFFTPTDSTNRYLGIWYNNKNSSDDNLEIIWVANRDSPIKDLSPAVLKMSGDGNLQVTDEQNTVYWSSNVSSRNANDSVAQLLDTGNLILHPRGSDTAIWQSFEHLTDSFLPGAKLIFNKSMYDAKTNIHSWKSSTDPSVGCFRVVSLPRDLPEFYIMEGKVPYWRSGPWNGYLFLGVPYLHAEVSFGLNVDDHNDSVEVSYELTEQSLFERYLLTSDGVMALKHWDDSSSSWRVEWQSLGSECDVYSKCGAFAVCDPRKDPICECLKGFKPKNVDEWSKGNWTNGCVRRTELECRAPGNKADKFLQLKNVKVPDYAQWIFANADACQRNCSRNCSCLAYSYYSGIGCMLWTVSLIDLQQYPADGADLFIRLAVSELPGKRDRQKIIITIAVILGAFVSIFVYYTRKWMSHRYESKAATPPKDTQWQNIFGTPSCSNDYQDLPVFEFQKLADATNDFSETNKLGRGGFGQVYKGKWDDGQEIAVKRLSRDSGQGLQEFMNEVMVISKLQHKNLVRLLGCCVEGEEKLLVYELMPNKSLDVILFDPQNRQFLDWQTRFSIIQGISRGLLYLHRDSRLRIIHRDLKPSNILLDEDLNPKISDFGTAKIFGTKQDQASTLRIVGTYGYMSPEYAMEGRFSEKSDVYSFGVLLLEIVSGRRINKLPDYDSLNLLAYAWKLWNDNDVGSLIDPTIRNPCSEAQTFKCVQVGLLCIQESPADRPDVSTLISMLDFDDVETLPAPKQPGFTQTKSPRNCQEHCSVNGCSMTTLCCR